MNRYDLHVHTTASDGRHSPAEVVRMAGEAGLAGIAITDHDTVAGLEEAIAAGQKHGVRVIAGVEISTVVEDREIHVLGYGFNRHDPLLLERLASQRRIRETRNEAILARLKQLGLPLADEEVREAAPRRDGSIGRPHIAEALVRKGYVQNVREAFDRYLAEGALAYVKPPRIGPLEAVRWIHEAGGKAIIAHPGLYRHDRLVIRLLEGGADGLEADHSDHHEEMVRHYRTLARKSNKLATGGSDFHGMRDGAAFHGRIGNRSVDVSVINRLLAPQATE